MAHDSPCVHLLRAETNLFEDLTYDVSIDNTVQYPLHPLHSVESKTAPIQFNIKGNDVNYLNFSESKLYIRCKIVDKNLQDIPYEADKTKSAYAPVNNFLHSLFESVSMSVNDTEITQFSKYYPYRSYIETILAKGKEYKKSIAQASCFYQTKDESSVTDPGWEARMRLADKSGVFEMIGRPNVDLLHQFKFIPPGVDIKLTFNRSPDPFCIQVAGTNPPNDLQVQIIEAQFIVTKHTLLNTVLVNQLKKWNSGTPMCYPMREIQMKTYNLPTGTISHYNETIISGYLPDRIVLGLVDSKNVHGSYATNPLVFQDFGLTNVNVTCNSEVQTPINMELDFDGNRYVRAYSALFEALGVADCDSGCELSLEEFKKSKTLFVFDLRHIRGAAATPRHGNCVINLKFKNAISKSLTVMCYLDYQSVMYINSNRRVHFKEFDKSR